MKKITGHILWFLFLSLINVSAQPKILTLENVLGENAKELQPVVPKHLSWLPSGEQYSYIIKDNLIIGNVADNIPDISLSLATLNGWLTAQSLDTLGKFPEIHWQDDQRFWFWKKEHLISADMQGNSARLLAKLPKVDEKRITSGTAPLVAYAAADSLYVLDKNGKTTLVAGSEGDGIKYGVSAHRREFGIRAGSFWSPEGKYLAFYRKDESMVTDYPYVDYSERPAVLKAAKYPMAGMANHLVTIGIYKTGSRDKIVWLKTGEPADQYFTNLTFSPDEKHLYMAHINRDQNQLRMIQYEAKSGKPKLTIFQESEEKYLDPQVGPIFLNDDSKTFLWLSQRDGWRHFYQYDRDGNFIKQLTMGNWEVVKYKGCDTEGKQIFFTATKDGVLNRHLYKLDLESGAIERLTKNAGTHDVEVSPDGRYFADVFSNMQTPGKAGIYDAAGSLLKIFHEAEDPLEAYQMGEVRIAPMRNNNGDSLFTRIIFPPNFEENQQYPLLVYVYGGPHSQNVQNRWLGGGGSWQLWLNYMATRGYIVMTTDNRGTYNRGLSFEQETFRQLGKLEVADQLSIVNSLVAKGIVDSSRIGVIGWSYGGFMSASLMLEAPERFKAGISGAPVTDWQYYETVYTERYMDTPETNAAGYEMSSTLNKLEQLQGKLLMIHGTSDNIVMWQHSVLFIEAAMKAGKQVDYMIYPGHKHGVRGKDRTHLFQRMTGWLEENL